MEIRNTQLTPIVDRNATNAKSSSGSKSVDKTQQSQVSSPSSLLAKTGNQQSFKNADVFRQTIREEASDSNKASGALEAYNSLEREEKRDQLRSMMGVDLYA